MMLTIRGSLVDASLLEGAWAAPLLGAHQPGVHTRPLSPAWRAPPPGMLGRGPFRRSERGQGGAQCREGARRRPDAGGTGRWQPGRSTREGAERRTVQVGEGRRRSGDRDRPRGESNQRIRFLWAKGIWVILCPALILKMDDWNRFVKEN